MEVIDKDWGPPKDSGASESPPPHSAPGRVCSRYNTRWALELLPELGDTSNETARLVTIFFGANDASLPDTNPRQHVPLGDFAANLRRMVGHCRAACPSAT